MKNAVLNVTEVESDNLFEVKLDNVKNLSHILKVLNFKEVGYGLVLKLFLSLGSGLLNYNLNGYFSSALNHYPSP